MPESVSTMLQKLGHGNYNETTNDTKFAKRKHRMLQKYLSIRIQARR